MPVCGISRLIPVVNLIVVVQVTETSPTSKPPCLLLYHAVVFRRCLRLINHAVPFNLMTFRQGHIEHPWSRMIWGLKIRIWVNLELDFASLTIFYPIECLIMGTCCLFVIFHDPTLDWTKWFNAPPFSDIDSCMRNLGLWQLLDRMKGEMLISLHYIQCFTLG